MNIFNFYMEDEEEMERIFFEEEKLEMRRFKSERKEGINIHIPVNIMHKSCFECTHGFRDQDHHFLVHPKVKFI